MADGKWNFKLWFDGSITKNPGGDGASGWVIEGRCGSLDAWTLEPVEGWEHHGTEFDVGTGIMPMTVNYTEYMGLILGVRAIREKFDLSAGGSLMIYGDSKLIINQVDGLWAINKPHLRALCKMALTELEGSRLKWHVHWTPRHLNERADAMTRKWKDRPATTADVTRLQNKFGGS